MFDNVENEVDNVLEDIEKIIGDRSIWNLNKKKNFWKIYFVYDIEYFLIFLKEINNIKIYK
jgi:hypothetical protein